MRKVQALVVAVGLATGARAGICQRASSQILTPDDVLTSSTDRDALEHAASALARSGDAKDLVVLGQLLRDRRFLARLDDLSNLKTFHLSRVMAALATHPTPEVAELCLTLVDDPVFLAERIRKTFLLKVLAAVKPMSERTAAVFQRSNQEGYFPFNATLLAGNGSPPALRLFEAMMLDRAVLAETRVESLHVCVLPRRMDPAILRAADRILSRDPERAIFKAVVESVFDFHQDWFGIESGISNPPGWQAASDESLHSALVLADKALARRDLDAALRQTVGRARGSIAQALTVRQK